MVINKFNLALRMAALTLIGATAACSSNKCYVDNNHQAYLNATSVADGTQISLCKGGASAGTHTVTPMAQYAPYNLTVYSWESSDRPSRYDGSCEDNHLAREKSTRVPVALTTAGFAVAKLCYHDTSKTSISFVMPGQPCPAGTTEQTAPVDDCSTL